MVHDSRSASYPGTAIASSYDFGSIFRDPLPGPSLCTQPASASGPSQQPMPMQSRQIARDSRDSDARSTGRPRLSADRGLVRRSSLVRGGVVTELPCPRALAWLWRELSCSVRHGQLQRRRRQPPERTQRRSQEPPKRPALQTPQHPIEYPFSNSSTLEYEVP